MGNPYLDVVLGSQQVKQPSPKPASTTKNPYMEVATTYNTDLRKSKKTANIDKTDAALKAMENESLIDAAKRFASNVPSTLKQIATNPKEAVKGVGQGVLDFGPQLSNLGNKIITSIFPGYADPKTGGFLSTGFEKTPSFSEGVAKVTGKETSDVRSSFAEGTKMAMAYAGGGAVTGHKTLAGITTGNILGGQLVVDPEASAKDRGTQAIFDGLFGVAEHFAPKVIASGYNKAVGSKPANPEMIAAATGQIDNHIASANQVVKELPVEEVARMGGMPALIERAKTNIVDGLRAQGHTGAASAIEKLKPTQFASVDDFAVAAKGRIAKGFRTAAESFDAPTPKAPEGAFSGEVPPQAGMDAFEVPATNPLFPDGNAVKTPETRTISKKSLGLDEAGNKVLAKTEVDTQTGNAIIYYDKSLDLPENAALKQAVLDHEQGHIIDKRVNEYAGNLSAELPNYGGNASNLDNVLGNFARSLNDSVESVVSKLQRDIEVLSGNTGANPGENFAEAFAKFNANPTDARKAAPTFSALMEFKPVPDRFSVRTTAADDLPVMKAAKESEKKSAAKAEKKVTTDFEDVADHLPDGQREDFLTHIKPKLDALPALKAGEVVVFHTGAGKWMDTEVYHAVERGVTAKTEVRIVKKSQLKSTGDAAKDAEGIRMLDDSKDTGTKPTKSKKPKDSVANDEKPPKRASKTAGGKFASTNLDTGKRVKGKSSINPDQINAPEDVEMFFNKMDAQSDNFSGQRISKSNEDLKDLARMVGLTGDDLINLKPGSIANSETTLAARQLILDKTSEFVNLLKSIDPSSMTDAQAKMVKDQFVRLVAIQKSVAGLRTEASNVLRSFGVELKPGENFAIADLAARLKEFGLDDSPEALEAFAGKMAKDYNLSPMQRVGGGFLQTWYAAILSGPKTTVRNVLSTSGNIVTDLASKSFNPRTWNEIPTAVSGMLRGLRDGIPDFKKEMSDALALRGDINPAESKFTDFGTLGTTKQPIFTGKFATYGKVVEIVGRFLNAQDKLLSGGAKEMEKAAVKVYSPGMTKNVEDALTHFYAEQSVYHGTAKGGGVRAVVSGMETLRAKAPIFKLIIPFVKTIGNVIDRQFDYMPILAQARLLPHFTSRIADDLVKATGVKLTKAERELVERRIFDQQLGRANLGLALTAASTALAFKGLISGTGPTNYNERLQLQRTGWRPNSLKIGDTWVPYSYLGPIAGIFALAGNIHDKVTYDDAPSKEIEGLVGSGIVGWMQSQLDQSFFSGVADLIETLEGTKDAKKYLTNLGTGLIPIPAAYSQTKDMIFRQQYETSGFVDKMRQKIGLTGNAFGMDPLHPRLDAMGQPMQNDLIYGITPSKETGDRVTNFLVANDIVVSVPLKNQDYSIPGRKEKVEMTPDQYEEYVRGSGQEIYKQLDALVPRMTNLSEEQRQDMVKSTVDSIREEWRYKILLRKQ